MSTMDSDQAGLLLRIKFGRPVDRWAGRNPPKIPPGIRCPEGGKSALS